MFLKNHLDQIQLHLNLMFLMNLNFHQRLRNLKNHLHLMNLKNHLHRNFLMSLNYLKNLMFHLQHQQKPKLHYH